MIKKEKDIKNNLITYQDVISIENLKKGLVIAKSNVSLGLGGEVKANFTKKKNRNFV